MGVEVTLSDLESRLWEAANILREPVDAADFKSYVFPLLFFKRISDVHDEEHAAALKQFDGDEEAAHFPENYGFQIFVRMPPAKSGEFKVYFSLN